MQLAFKVFLTFTLFLAIFFILRWVAPWNFWGSKITFALLAVLITIVVVVIWAERAGKKITIGTVEAWKRGGDWAGGISDNSRLQLYAACAAFSEAVYDRKNPPVIVGIPFGWRSLERSEIILASGEPREQWAEFFPPENDPSDNFEFAFRVWQRDFQDKSEVVIAFRGTNDAKDNKSNFRWLWKFLNKEHKDQYDLVHTLTPKLIMVLKKLYGTTTRIIVTGHSLGGGLAQAAAYSVEEIKEVYIFAPSPVTSFKQIEKKVREEGRKRIVGEGVKIDRVYEKGEGLFIPRALIRPYYALTPLDPNITEIRFNFSKFTIDSLLKLRHPLDWFVGEHGITKLAISLNKLASDLDRQI